MKQPLGVVLAGGRAMRMGGGDKGLLDLDGQSILHHVIDRLEPQVAGLAINANGPADRFAEFRYPVIADTIPDFAGPLAGILAGLDWAATQGADSIVTVAADTPFFPCDLVPRLMLAADDMVHPLALAATSDGMHPTFGLWPVGLRDDLRAALGNGVRKVILWTNAHGAKQADFSDTGEPFFNVNTPEDLETARRRANR